MDMEIGLDWDIAFQVDGKPQGKERPRFDSVRKMTYTPQKTRDYENLVRTSYKAKYGAQQPLQGEITALIIAYYPIPKSTSKRLKKQMLEYSKKPTVKPDLDNIIKAILDALNGCAYADDAAVVEVHAYKRYSLDPCVEVFLKGETATDE